METNRLKHFCAVAELESLSKASELLGITHSGLHKSMRVLEDELGFSLTKAKGRGICLTEKAKGFYPKALEIVELVEKTLKVEHTVDAELIKIGGLEVFTPFLASQFLEDQILSTLNIEFHEFGPGKLEEAVKNKVLDYGLTYIPISTRGIQFLKISNFKMGIYVKNKNFKNKSIFEIPFVVPYSPLENNPADIKNRDGWSSTKIQRKIKYKTNSLFTALEIVKAGLAALYVPKFVGEYYKEQIVEFEINDKEVKQKRDAYLILRETSVEDEYAKKLAKIVRKWLK